MQIKMGCNFYFNIRNMHLTYFLSKSKCSLVGKLYKMILKYMCKYIYVTIMKKAL